MAGSVRRYLEKKADLQARRLHHNGAADLDTVVVIPALAEKDHLFRTLEFLAQNPAGDLARTLVICVINNRRQPPATPDQVRNNQETLARLEAMTASSGPLRLGYIDASSPGFELPDKGGVGLARKMGLDWGLALLAETVGEPGLLVAPHATGISRTRSGVPSRVGMVMGIATMLLASFASLTKPRSSVLTMR